MRFAFLHEERHRVVAIHGILTGLTSPSWATDFAPWAESRHPLVRAQAHRYAAGPFPLWNHAWTNPRQAKAAAMRLREAMRHDPPLRTRIHLVAHSNGAKIAVSVAKLLAREGVRTETLVLVGAALHSDVRRNGLEKLVESGEVGRCVAFCSREDLVVAPLQRVPGFYGSLGARGWERAGEPFGAILRGTETMAPAESEAEAAFVTRWFEGAGHGGYWEGALRGEVFGCVLADMGLAD